MDPESELDEVQRYLDEARADRKVDTVTWWKLHAHRLPHLACMARDYMSIPASSVPSEQLFSRYVVIKTALFDNSIN